MPVDTNRTDEGRAHNRRIEFRVTRISGQLVGRPSEAESGLTAER